MTLAKANPYARSRQSCLRFRQREDPQGRIVRQESPGDRRAAKEENAAGMVGFCMKEEHLIRFPTRPKQNVCTDGLLGGKPHPRVFGSFPRVLGKYVREEKALTLEDAIRKMTSEPAEVFRFQRRGSLKRGYFAVAFVFNPDTVIDNGTFADPVRYGEGIGHVLVNGQMVVDCGVYHPRPAGRILRRRGF